MLYFQEEKDSGSSTLRFLYRVSVSLLEVGDLLLSEKTLMTIKVEYLVEFSSGN